MGGVGEVVEGRGTGARAPMLFLSQAEDLRAKKNYFRTATAQNPYYYQGNKKFPCLSEDHFKTCLFCRSQK